MNGWEVNRHGLFWEMMYVNELQNKLRCLIGKVITLYKHEVNLMMNEKNNVTASVSMIDKQN